MVSLDFTGKVALVTGVGDNQSFAWFISKALKAAGAKVVLAVHPRSFHNCKPSNSRRNRNNIHGQFPTACLPWHQAWHWRLGNSLVSLHQ